MILLDTCLGMNVEALSQMGTEAIVVGGETTLNSSMGNIQALPLVEMLRAAVAHSDSAPNAARAMLGKASELYDHHYSPEDAKGLAEGLERLSQLMPPAFRGNRAAQGELALNLGLGQAPKISVVGLAEFQKDLLPTLGPLGKELSKEIQGDHHKQVLMAAWQTMIPVSEQKFVDLGGFLQRLAQEDALSNSTREAIKATLRGLERCKLDENHPQDFNSDFAGVSVQICAQPDDEYWKLQGLPRDWTEFVRQFSNPH